MVFQRKPRVFTIFAQIGLRRHRTFLFVFRAHGIENALHMRSGPARTYSSARMYYLVFGTFVMAVPMKARLYTKGYKIIISSAMQQTRHTYSWFSTAIVDGI